MTTKATAQHMPSQIDQGPCRCEFRFKDKISRFGEIYFCPLHAAAPEMLALIRAAFDLCDGGWPDARALLARIEGP